MSVDSVLNQLGSVTAAAGDADVPWWGWLAFGAMLVLGPLVRGRDDQRALPPGLAELRKKSGSGS
jgi:hypothetical protein